MTGPFAADATVATRIEAAFAVRIPVRPVASGSLPRFEFKAKRWVKE